MPAGQPAASEVEEVIPSRVFTARDGIPGENVRAVAQTSDGRLWVGTSQGLAYFDGYRFHPVDFPDFENVGIYRLFASPDGSLWISSGEGVWWRGKDEQMHRVQGLDATLITSFVSSAEGMLLFGYTNAWLLATGEAVPRRLTYGYDVKTPARARASGGGEGSGPIAALDTGNGFVVLDRLLGPGRFDPLGTAGFVSGNRGEWTDLAIDSHGRLWALDFDRGLFWVDESLHTHLVFPLSRGNRLTISDDVAYITTRGAIQRYDLMGRRPMQPLDESLGLGTSSAHVAVVDREGSLWIGTRSLLIQVPALGVRHITRVGNEPLRNIALTAPASDGELWAISYMGGLLRIDGEPQMVRPLGTTAWSVVDVVDGVRFALGRSGLVRYRAGEWELARQMPGAVRGAMGSPRDAYVWKDNGAFHYQLPDGGVQQLFAWPVDDRDYHMIARAPDGSVVMRARESLLRIVPGRDDGTEVIATIPEMRDARGRALLVDPSGGIWAGFWGEGVFHVAPGGPVQMLAGERVRRLNLSGDSLVFASTERGLFAIDVSTGAIRARMDRGDGLLSSVTTGAVIHEQALYVAHPIGVTRLPLDVLTSAMPTPLSVVVGPASQHAVARDGTPILSRNATFQFFATSYLNPDAITYEYRMPPERWVQATGTQVELHKLRGGRHSLEVRARYRGAEFGLPARYSFLVPTPPHQAGWFRGLLLGVGVLLAITVALARSRAARRREEELTRLVEDRTGRLAESMRLTRRQAEQLSAQDEVKRRFFANISHEFRTPLTVVRGIITDLGADRHGDLDPAAKRQLAIAREQTDRLTRLVEELLDLARLDAGKVELQRLPGDLLDAARRIVRAQAPAAERVGVRLEFRANAADYPALFDSSAIEKILTNLVSNAIRHTDEPGRVEVTFSPCSANDGVEISVTDDGCGIESSLLPEIFDRYTSGRDLAGSSGIGLALVRELVALHDGDIEVTSEVGHGSCFTVRLPIKRQEISADEDETILPSVLEGHDPQSVGTVPSAAPIDHETVLVVDDNIAIRSYLTDHLAERYHVLCASNGREALEIALDAQPAAIISDLVMPVMDGVELCREIRAHSLLAHIPILLLTARAGSENVVDGLAAGADAYVEKPFDMPALLARLERLVAKSRELRDHFSGRLVVESLGVTIESADEGLVRRVVETIESNLADTTFDSGVLAAEVGLSARQLRRRLQEAIGCSPGALIRHHRLERGAQMLTGGVGTVAEVSFRVGYAKPAAFSAQFKRHFGVSPSEYSTQGTSRAFGGSVAHR